MDKYYTNHEVTVPATELAVRLEDARQHLRMDDLRHDDLYIETLIKSASKYAEETYDYALLTQTVVEKHSRFPDTYTTPMYLTVIPAATVTSVTYIDCDGNTQTWASSEYEYYLKGKQPYIIPKPAYTYPTDLAMRCLIADVFNSSPSKRIQAWKPTKSSAAYSSSRRWMLISFTTRMMYFEKSPQRISFELALMDESIS